MRFVIAIKKCPVDDEAFLTLNQSRVYQIFCVITLRIFK